MGTFKALVIDKTDSGQSVGFRAFDETDLMDGDVTVRVSHSTLNYKDGLALTGKAPVVRRLPMIPGVDLVGNVEASSHPEFRAGDAVILNGWGLGETHLGAYAEKVRVKGEWLIPLPAGLTPHQAMAIGTAGYTAMLCLMALEKHGLKPERGPAIVTGAVGGVGSVAVALLARAGWHVIAATGRPEEAEYLRGLGAAEILERSELTGPVRPLGKERWAAGVDTVGSVPLANVISMTKYGGAIAACGLAAGMDLPATVAPFILRNVSLLGVDSVMAPKPRRIEAWNRLVHELDHAKLAAMTSTIPLDEVMEAGRRIVAGQVKGRVVVEIG